MPRELTERQKSIRLLLGTIVDDVYKASASVYMSGTEAQLDHDLSKIALRITELRQALSGEREI